MKNKKNDNLKKVFEFIKDYTRCKGYPPTVREIGMKMGFKSTSTSYAYLVELEKENYISFTRGKSRSIELIEERSAVMSIPSFGKISAGLPIEAIQTDGEELLISENFFSGSPELFILTVKGESMINAGILDGDKVVIRKQDKAENGKIVAVLLNENEATVKRIFFKNQKVYLHPENPYMDDIIADDVKILGIVVGLLRNRI